MKAASSIRYGGMLVDADECDYSSFKNLGLLCPICKRTVFLVKETTRQATIRKKKDGTTCDVKGSNVSSYFAHHPEVDKNTVNDCELRSDRITIAQRAYLEVKAHGQRQKALQAHFWKIIKSGYSVGDLDPELIRDFITYTWIQACIYSEKKALFCLQELINFLISRVRLVDSNCATEKMSLQIESVVKHFGTGQIVEYSNSDEKDAALEYYGDLMSGLDKRMQAKISVEAFLFIQQKKQVKMLESLIYLGIYMLMEKIIALDASSKNIDRRLIAESSRFVMIKQLIGADEHFLNEFSEGVVDSLAYILSEVRWAYQFELLEQKDIERQLTSPRSR